MLKYGSEYLHRQFKALCFKSLMQWWYSSKLSHHFRSNLSPMKNYTSQHCKLTIIQLKSSLKSMTLFNGKVWHYSRENIFLRPSGFIFLINMQQRLYTFAVVLSEIHFKCPSIPFCIWCGKLWILIIISLFGWGTWSSEVFPKMLSRYPAHWFSPASLHTFLAMSS